jgi:hypothetical protein
MKITTKIKYSLALVLFSVTLQAQESFPDDVNDVPIDDYNWIIAAAIIGIVIGYWSFQKKKIVK